MCEMLRMCELFAHRYFPFSLFFLFYLSIFSIFFFQDIRFILFPIGLLISAVFLSATLAARYILPTNHHILHWRCQTFYVTCLLIGDLLLAFTQLFGRNVNGVACISVGMQHIAIFCLCVTYEKKIHYNREVERETDCERERVCICMNVIIMLYNVVKHTFSLHRNNFFFLNGFYAVHFSLRRYIHVT